MKISTIDNGWEMGKFISGKCVANGNTIVNQTWDYIVTTSGEILVGPKHSFLSKGKEVLAAGEIKFNNGVVKNINNASGHYLPTEAEASNFLRIFKNADIDVSKATLEIIDENGKVIKAISPTHSERHLFE